MKLSTLMLAIPLPLAFIPLLATPSPGAQVYGVGGTGGQDGIYLIDTVTGVTTFVFDPGLTLYGATDGEGPSWFFATSGIGRSLYRIDVANRIAIEVGPSGGVSVSELAYNESNCVLYGTDFENLYFIDKDTGRADLIGPHDGPISMFAMDYHISLGRLIGVNWNGVTGHMYDIDMNTGLATLIGPTGQDRITDVWYDHDSGSLFGVGNGPGRLYILDPVTGEGQLLHMIDPDDLMGLGHPAPMATAIEPTTWGAIKASFKMPID